MRIDSQVGKRIKTEDLKKFGNNRIFPENYRIIG